MDKQKSFLTNHQQHNSRKNNPRWLHIIVFIYLFEYIIPSYLNFINIKAGKKFLPEELIRSIMGLDHANVHFCCPLQMLGYQ